MTVPVPFAMIPASLQGDQVQWPRKGDRVGRGVIIGAVLASIVGAAIILRPAPDPVAPGPGMEASPMADAAIAASPKEPVTRAYTADEACADCHPDHASGFAKTGMGRSLYPPQDATRIERFGDEAATIEHTPTGLVYRAHIDQEGRWWQTETRPGTDYSRSVEVAYIIGSGNSTRSYLGWVENELIELPLTWYSQRKIWDMSPGYLETNMRFSRAVTAQCLFCHNNLTPMRDGTESGFHLPLAHGISCNRCHGDGTQHVANHQAGKPDSTILNPKTLSSERQLQICQQCHLQGVARILRDGKRWDAYSPSEPLSDYVSIYVPAGADGPEFGIASQGYRLSLSRCATVGGATCSHCHSAHEVSTPENYQASCKSCHADKPCSSSEAHQGDCVKCHMRKDDTSDIPHVRFVDHYIRKRIDDPVVAVATSANFVDALNPNGADSGAQLRLALAHFETWKQGGDDHGPAHRDAAEEQLEIYTQQDPDSARAQAALARLRFKTGDHAGAVQAFATAVKLKKDDPMLLADYALAQQNAGDLDGAGDSLKAALKLRPDFRLAVVNLANIKLQTKSLKQAETLYLKAGAMAPHLALIRINHGRAAQARGNFPKARALYREAVKLDPHDVMGHLHLALLEYDRRRFRETRRALRNAIGLHPKHPGLYWLRGRVAAQERDGKAALKDYRLFLKHAPDDPNAWLEVGMQLARLDRPEEAIKVLNEGKAKIGHDEKFNSILRIINNRPKVPEFPEMGFEIHD